MKSLKDLTVHKIVDEGKIGELSSTGAVLEHKKTGARMFLVSSDNEDKVFYVGFRTPPSDDTGVPYVLERSVLCDSNRFPVKGPFIGLVRDSLNTFLSAVIYPSEMAYPATSCNDRDFQNLVGTYMGAVLHPNIYSEKKIFMQEGWYYELESEDSPITHNGVVYNEVKSAFFSPESILGRYAQKVLFPDACYGSESSGNLKSMSDLAYEAFLDFRRAYYHPSNSFICFCGDTDMAEKLK